MLQMRTQTMSKKPKPNLVVSGKSASDGYWKPIGVGWTNKAKDGTKYIHVKMDFVPNTCELTIWPMAVADGDKRTEDLEPTPITEEEEK
jgi:uncharacterized protein (DUF736 family)